MYAGFAQYCAQSRAERAAVRQVLSYACRSHIPGGNVRPLFIGAPLALVAGLLLAAAPQAQSDRALEVSQRHFDSNRGAYGIGDPASELKVRGKHTDEKGVSHVRYDQFYRGLQVFEGEAIAHVDADDTVTVTNALRAGLSVDVQGRISRAEAEAIALRYIAPLGAYEVRDVSRWVVPRGERSIIDRAAWRVIVAVDNEFEDPAEWHYFIDADTGAVVLAFDGLQTAKGGKPGGGGGGGGGTTGDVAGVAKTMYSGDQEIRVDQTAATTFYLRDLTRGDGGNVTCDMRNAQANCYYIIGSTPTFGTGAISLSGPTAGADAHFGLQATWDYYEKMFGRNGIDNANRRTYSRVHYGRNYENAFWSDACFCMTYGDGASTFYPLVSIDVAAHEMSHGVMSREANLTYSGESGGLNESNSDIFGTLVEDAVNSAKDQPDYWIGERIYKSNYSGGTFNQTKALRYMDDPALDGRSPACWSSSLGSLNVHYSSGPNNHMFYLLAEGGTSKCNGNEVDGIGPDAAARIWYKAITDYMTASTNYAQARTAALNAAVAIYGANSSQAAAVAAAYAAINVN
jgi:Zn-dependent metalloprotease